jgi:aromatic ring-opening dioxygenase LigB subunit
MSLVFSAIVPHSPLLLPQIGKENINQLANTLNAYEKIREELEKSEAETILIISPHGLVQNTAFTMNLSPEFVSNFQDFGDFGTKIKWPSDIALSFKIRQRMETRAPMQLISEPSLDYGSAIPLCLLTKNLPQIKIIPLYYSGLNNEMHYKFGKLLNREIIFNKEKIAVLASGELSHRLTRSAPGGYSPKGKKFDKKITTYLQENKFQEIVDINEDEATTAQSCGLKSIITLLGIMEGIKHTPQLLSYESPFGIGYLTMNFKL